MTKDQIIQHLLVLSGFLVVGVIGLSMALVVAIQERWKDLDTFAKLVQGEASAIRR